MVVRPARVMALASRMAAGQWGLLTTAQAEREGITRLQLARLADAGVLERIDRGVYATAWSSSEYRALRAAWLALDPTRTVEERLTDSVTAGVASHTSAAALHRLGDLLDDLPEITLPNRKQSRRGVRLHRGQLSVEDVTLVDGLPTTTEERTVADLLRDGHDPEHIATMIGQGVQRGVIDLNDLAAHLGSVARRHGQPDGDALVEYLLDLVGLSSAALARELVNSPAGQELVAAGRAGALSDLVASLIPQIDAAQLIGLSTAANSLGKIDMSKLIAASGVLDSIDPLKIQVAKSAFTPQLHAAVANLSAPAVRAALSSLQSPASYTAIEAARSSDIGTAKPGLAAQPGKRTTRAAAAVTTRTEGSQDNK